MDAKNSLRQGRAGRLDFPWGGGLEVLVNLPGRQFTFVLICNIGDCCFVFALFRRLDSLVVSGEVVQLVFVPDLVPKLPP